MVTPALTTLLKGANGVAKKMTELHVANAPADVGDSRAIFLLAPASSLVFAEWFSSQHSQRLITLDAVG
jgi:hypothetical protein